MRNWATLELVIFVQSLELQVVLLFEGISDRRFDKYRKYM